MNQYPRPMMMEKIVKLLDGQIKACYIYTFQNPFKLKIRNIIQYLIILYYIAGQNATNF